MRSAALRMTILAVAALAGGCAVAAGLGDPKILETDAGQDSAPPGDGGITDAAAPSIQAVSIALGSTHGCAAIQGSAPDSPDNGTVRCWGSNTAGELGADPTMIVSSFTPLLVAGATSTGASIASLALSNGYSCGVDSMGYFLCWGAVPAETGAGVHRESEAPAYVPSLVDFGADTLVGVTSASVGEGGGCVMAQSELVCWGAAIYTQPRDGGSSGFDSGVVIADIKSAAVGRAHVCAIATRSAITDVECWGDNTYGQAGVPGGVNPVVYPTPVGLSQLGVDIQAVAAGSDHTCALLVDGSVYCWGRNDRGQLGNPDLTSTSTPTLVPAFAPTDAGAGLSGVELALGDSHTCAVTSGNYAHCWGDNSAGELGVGPSTTTSSTDPLTVNRGTPSMPLSRIHHIAAGGQTTCALRFGDPQVWCWGANGAGQAGQPASATLPAATAMSW